MFVFVRISSCVIPGGSATVYGTGGMAVLNFFKLRGQNLLIGQQFVMEKMYGQSIIGTRVQYICGMVMEYEKSVARARMCAITRERGCYIWQ